jgi:hypothetical protein
MTAGHFLNVDLEIESSSDLAPLAAELEPDACALYCGPAAVGYLLNLELNSRSADTDGPDERIHKLCQLVEALSPAGRQGWQSASRRTFDVGYDATTAHMAARFALRTDTLERIARMGATLTVTVYRADPEARPMLRPHDP